MSLIKLSLKHGRTQDEARSIVESAVADFRRRFGAFVQKTDWTSDRNRVTIAGIGFRIDLRVDPEQLHVEGDLPFLGPLLGSPVMQGLKQALETRFQKKLTDEPKPS